MNIRYKHIYKGVCRKSCAHLAGCTDSLAAASTLRFKNTFLYIPKELYFLL
jgi:hypothetical protein